jgi:hypothetical protein
MGTQAGGEPVEDAAQVALERLRGDWPRWNIWTVPKAIGGTVWCAHSSGDERHVLNEESAADLEWAMTSASQYRLARGGR